MIDKKTILKVENLSVQVINGRKRIDIVKNVSFEVKEGERWAVAGESGAGKSMTMKAITALMPQGSTAVSGKILFRTDAADTDAADTDNTGTDAAGQKYTEQGNTDQGWQDLLALPYAKRHAFVARHVAIIFQDSINALNPNERIIRQWSETVRLYEPGIGNEELEKHLLSRMDIFGVRGGKETLYKYPDQLSGGMRQRIAIAMALESPARLLIADEPTTSLDAINQRSTVDFIQKLLNRSGRTLLYISHNLGLLQYICDHIIIMKDGYMIEQGTTDEVFFNGKEDYTRQLVRETMKIMGHREEGDPHE